MPSWRDWEDPFDDSGDGLWEPLSERESDETHGWLRRATQDGPRMTFAHARRLVVEAAGGVYDCRGCPGSFKDPHARVCDLCRRPRPEWEALTMREAA